MKDKKDFYSEMPNDNDGLEEIAAKRVYFQVTRLKRGLKSFANINRTMQTKRLFRNCTVSRIYFGCISLEISLA